MKAEPWRMPPGAIARRQAITPAPSGRDSFGPQAVVSWPPAHAIAKDDGQEPRVLEVTLALCLPEQACSSGAIGRSRGVQGTHLGLRRETLACRGMREGHVDMPASVHVKPRQGRLTGAAGERKARVQVG
jgi:hypothetical protein